MKKRMKKKMKKRLKKRMKKRMGRKERTTNSKPTFKQCRDGETIYAKNTKHQ